MAVNIRVTIIGFIKKKKGKDTGKQQQQQITSKENIMNKEETKRFLTRIRDNSAE